MTTLRTTLLCAASVLLGLVPLACGEDDSSSSPGADGAEIINGGSGSLLVGSSMGLLPGDLALTFDDGPSTEHIEDPISTNPTLVLARELAKRNIPTTFFQIAQFATPAVEEELLGYKTPDGKHRFHIANHTMHHIVLDTLPRTAAGNQTVISEINDADHVLAPYMTRSLGLDPSQPHDKYTDYRFFRAPGGQLTNNHFSPAEIQGRVDAVFNSNPDAMRRYVGPVYWDVGGFTAANGVYTGDWGCPGAHISVEDCASGYFKEIIRLKGRGQIVLAHDSHAFTVRMFTMPGGVLDQIDAFNQANPTQALRYVHIDARAPKIRALLDKVPSDLSAAAEPTSSADADGGAPPPASVPGSTCHSGTLNRDVAEATCVQSKSDNRWYECKDGAWTDRATDTTACSATFPL